MKKKLSLIVLLLVLPLILSGCGNKYKGYWCNYKELATIVVQFEDNHTDKQVEAIENKAASYDNVSSTNYITREDYAKEQGVSIDDLDIHDTFVIYFTSMDSIGTYIEEIKEMKGVLTADQNYAKANISLYNLKSWGKYEFTDSDEAKEEDIEKGTYRIKNGVITFTPNDSKTSTKLLYIKDNHLCGDADCNEIYAESTETCSGKTS
ncbi:MAG: permease-like cell division protein FtsX [Bacilli bacterium]|nr:permease-like cell division protein FtsX [Bacilli bacterium]